MKQEQLRRAEMLKSAMEYIKKGAEIRNSKRGIDAKAVDTIIMTDIQRRRDAKYFNLGILGAAALAVGIYFFSDRK